MQKVWKVKRLNVVKVERQELQGMPRVGGAVQWTAVQGRRCCSSQPKMHFPLARKWHSRKNLKGNGAGAKCKLSRKQLQQKCRGGSVCRIDGTLLSFSALPPLLSLFAPSASPILVCFNLHIATVSDMFELSLCAQTLSSIDMLDVNCLTHSIFGLRDWSQWKSSLN